jgi:hypothetical protein
MLTNIVQLQEERLFQNKYKILLIMLNEILKIVKKDEYEEIFDILNFKNIEAHDMKTDETTKIYNILEKEILTCYTREQLRHGLRKLWKNYAFAVIGFMAEDIGYNFEKTHTKQITTNKKKVTHAYYAITKKI